jgi:hypothetical protein
MIPQVVTAMFVELKDSDSAFTLEDKTTIGAKHRATVSEMGW